MYLYYNKSRLIVIIIGLCLLICCSHREKKIPVYVQVMDLLERAENTADFATKEACISQAVEFHPNKWLLLETLYIEHARAQEQLEDKIFYLNQAIKTVNKYSIDYHSLEIHREIGALYYENQHIEQALASYNKMMQIELKYISQRQDNDFIFKSLFTQYLDDCLMVGKIYLDVGDTTKALYYFKESRKYFRELQQTAYKDKTLFTYLADKFIQLGDIYEGLGRDEDKISCYELGIKFQLLDLEYRLDNRSLEPAIEQALKTIVAFRKIDAGKELAAEKSWAKFLLAKYYAEQDMRESAIDFTMQVLDSDFEYLPNVGNIMTIMRYIPRQFIFSQENQYEIHIRDHNRRLLELMLKKYHAISKTFYKRFTLEDLHNWLLISLLVEDYADIRLILKKTIELKPERYAEKKIRLWNMILHNIGVVYFRKSSYRRAEFYLKRYYQYAKDLLSTFNLAVIYLTMNDFNKAQPLLLEYKKQYPGTAFSNAVEKYLSDSATYLTAGNPGSLFPIKLEQSIVPIAK